MSVRLYLDHDRPALAKASVDKSRFGRWRTTNGSGRGGRAWLAVVFCEFPFFEGRLASTQRSYLDVSSALAFGCKQPRPVAHQSRRTSHARLQGRSMSPASSCDWGVERYGNLLKSLKARQFPGPKVEMEVYVEGKPSCWQSTRCIQVGVQSLTCACAQSDQ